MEKMLDVGGLLIEEGASEECALLESSYEEEVGPAEEELLNIDEPTEEEMAFTSLEDLSLGDSLRLYLREIGQVPLLTQEEEVHLAQEIVRGRDAECALRKLFLVRYRQKAEQLEFKVTEKVPYKELQDALCKIPKEKKAAEQLQHLATILNIRDVIDFTDNEYLEGRKEIIGYNENTKSKPLFLEVETSMSLLEKEEDLAVAKDERLALLNSHVLFLASRRYRKRVRDFDKVRYDALEERYVKILEDIVKCGKNAKDRFTQANLRLAVAVAKRHEVPKNMTLLDLIQEGNVGLMRAVAKFDYTKGYKFSTYATWWIRQAVSRATVRQARMIKLPVQKIADITRIKKVAQQISQEKGREATTEEIAERMGLPTDRIGYLQEIAQSTLSLSTPLGQDSEKTLGSAIPARNVQNPAQAAYASMREEEFKRQVLSKLTEREYLVLSLRYGIKDGKTRTLEEIGQRLNVSRERVRQIEKKMEHKLSAEDIEFLKEIVDRMLRK